MNTLELHALLFIRSKSTYDLRAILPFLINAINFLFYRIIIILLVIKYISNYKLI